MISPPLPPPVPSAPSSAEAWHEIHRFLDGVSHRLRRRERERLAGVVLQATLGGLLLSTLAAAWLALDREELLAPLRLGLLLLAAAGVTWSVRALRRAHQRVDGARAAAAHCARSLPGLGDALLSSVELDAARPLLEQRGSSEALVDAHLGQVASRLDGRRAEEAVDLKPTRRTLSFRLGGVGVAWLLGLAATPGPGALGQGLRALLLGPGPRPLAVSRDPIVGDVTLVVESPPYAGLPVQRLEGYSGQVTALPGSILRVEARPLVEGRPVVLLFEPEGGAAERLEAIREGAGASERIRGLLRVAARGQWRFALGGLKEPEGHRLEIDTDRPPTAELVAPADQVALSESRAIELGWSVEDDYGIGAVELVWRVGEGAEQRRTVQPAPAPPTEGARPARTASGTYRWELTGIARGEEAQVAYHLEVRDTDTVTGPKVGRSRELRLGVRDPEAAEEETLAVLDALLDQAVRTLADRLEASTVSTATAHASHQAFAAAVGKVSQALAQRAARAVATTAQRPPAASQPAGSPQAGQPSAADERRAALGRKLRDMADRLSALADKEAPLLSASAGHKSAAALVAKILSELETDSLLLDDLRTKQRLEELLRLGDELAAAKQRLRQLLEEYKRTGDPRLKEQIQQAVADLQRKLAALRERAGHMEREVPDEFLNREALGKNQAQDAASALQKAVDSNNLDEAMAQLDRLSSQLDQMTSAMEGGLSQLRNERFSEEEKRRGEAEDALAELVHEEQEIHKEADQLRRRGRERTQAELERLRPELERARRDAQALRKRLADVDQDSVPRWDQPELESLRQRASNVERTLQAEDLEEARSEAERAAAEAGRLAQTLRDELSIPLRTPKGQKAREQAQSELAESARTARDLAQRLASMVPPERKLSSDDQRRLEELAERQAATRKRTAELQQKLGQLDRPAPSEAGEEQAGDEAAEPAPGKGGPPKPTASPDAEAAQSAPGQSLEQAAGHMGRAESQLRRSDAMDAEREARQALERLSEAKRQLREQRRPRDGAGGGRQQKETVKIPGADQFQAPKEFRQDILEAMKRGAPGAWKQQVQRYYEELVK